MAKAQFLLLILGALVMAVVSIILIFFLLQKKGGGVGVVKEQEEMVAVLVATNLIPAGSKINAGQVTHKWIPKKVFVSGMVEIKFEVEKENIKDADGNDVKDPKGTTLQRPKLGSDGYPIIISQKEENNGSTSDGANVEKAGSKPEAGVKSSLPEGKNAFTDLMALYEKEEMCASHDIPPQDIIFTGKISKKSEAAKASLVIDKGMRLVPLQYQDVQTGGGLVRNGDYVDVVAFITIGEGEDVQKLSRIVLERVKIFEINGGETPSSGGKEGEAKAARSFTSEKVATLLVKPEDALKISYLQNGGGYVFSLILRRYDDESRADQPVYFDYNFEDDVLQEGANDGAGVPIETTPTTTSNNSSRPRQDITVNTPPIVEQDLSQPRVQPQGAY